MPGERQSGEERGQVLAREGPLEWVCGRFVPVLESEQRLFKGGEVGEIARRQDLALYHGEVDLNLDAVLRRQRLALPDPGIQIEDGPRLGGERRIAREQPPAMAPAPDGIGGEPAPDGRPTDGGPSSVTWLNRRT